MMRLKMLAVMTLMSTMIIGTISAAVTHIIGGDAGWKLVPENPHFYEQWGGERMFGIDDKLFFRYNPKSSKVTMVGESDYKKCTKNEIIDSWSSGQTMLELTRPGDYYFVGGTGLQCRLGQRLHVKVTDGSKKPGPDNFDFHFNTVRKDDDAVPSVGDAATDAAKEAAEDRAKQAAYNATADVMGPIAPSVNDAYDNANETYNDAVEDARGRAYNETTKAVNKTADAAASSSSSSSLQSLGVEATLLSVLVAMWV